MTAMRTGDPSAFGDLLADDVVFMPPYQRERRGKQDVLAWFAEFVSQVRTVAVDASNREVVVSGDAAFDSGAFTWTVQPLAGGAPIEDRGHFMAMLPRQADGTWKVTRDLWNSSVPVAAAV